MIETAKIARVWSAGMVLLFGLFIMETGGVASAAEQDKTAKAREAGGTEGQGLPCEISPGQNRAQAEQNANLASRVITGELIKMDGTDFVVKEESGKEVHFQLTERTRKTPVNKGDRISVDLDNHDNALWIKANRGTTPRTEHASADCNPTEEPSDKLMKKSKGK